MRKGITPIISVIILLLITIALAGAAWTFLQGVLLTQTAKAFSIPTGGAFCSNGKITVLAANIGTSTLAETDFSVVMVDGNAVSASTVSIAAGSSAKVLDNYDCDAAGTANCVSGIHDVAIGTSANVQRLSVSCA